MTIAYAEPADIATYGPYGPGRLDQPGPRYPFQGRIGSPDYKAEPGRYHLYVAWACPWAQRAAIVRILKGLQDVVSLSYVDDERDARGWAFRERRGADPVNGFTYLRQAYDATDPGYPGHLSVPVLWDRATDRIVSNHFPDITIDLGTRFEEWGDPGVQLYPEALRPQIDELNEFILVGVNLGPPKVEALELLDARLADRRYLFGDEITESDVRLWVSLARYERLPEFGRLWAYTRDLHTLPAFRDTTDLDTVRKELF